MRNRPLLWLAALAATAFFLCAYPLYVIRPFRYQGSRELAAALLMARYREGIEAVIAIAAIILCVRVWRQSALWRRLLSVFFTLMVVGSGILSHVNVYEQMFHPVRQPTFSHAAQAKLDPREQVIAIRIGNAARAYPIRIMSYHHLINDSVGGRFIVATY